MSEYMWENRAGKMKDSDMAEFLIKFRDRGELPITEEEYLYFEDIANRLLQYAELIDIFNDKIKEIGSVHHDN